jgi:pimeloyl-ACP methyl ester carboxylesterase
LIHGAGDVGWYWHRVEAELCARGHDVVAPDLPGDDDSLQLDDYATAVIATIADRRELVLVAQSFGGFTAPLVAARLPVTALVFVAGMIPAPGEAPNDWWNSTGYRQAVQAQAARDGVTGSSDPYVCFYHDVPRELAAQALSKERAHPSAAALPRRGRSQRCRTSRLTSSCARRTAAFLPTFCGAWSPSDWASCPTRSRPVTAWR